MGGLFPSLSYSPDRRPLAGPLEVRVLPAVAACGAWIAKFGWRRWTPYERVPPRLALLGHSRQPGLRTDFCPGGRGPNCIFRKDRPREVVRCFIRLRD